MDLLYNIDTNGSGKNRGEGKGGGCLWKFPVSGPSLHSSSNAVHSPPDVERTLTVGREAIVEDSLEDVLRPTVSGDSVDAEK